LRRNDRREDDRKALRGKLRVIERRVRDIRDKVADGSWRPDVVTEIAAIQWHLDEVALGLVQDQAQACGIQGPELVQALGRLMRPDYAE
jgi:DNA-binding FrmR family transcriptional regulator